MKHKVHIRLFDWLTLAPIIISLFEMVPTKGVMTGTITNFFEGTTEVTNFNFGSQTVGYSPFTTTNLDASIVWTLSAVPVIYSIDQKNRGNVKAAVILASLCSIGLVA